MRVDCRYQGTDNGFNGPPAFNTTQDYINFANVTMRQRMATYIAGGGLKPLIGEWSFITGVHTTFTVSRWGNCHSEVQGSVSGQGELTLEVGNSEAKLCHITYMGLYALAMCFSLARLLPAGPHLLLTVTPRTECCRPAHAGPVKSGQTAFPDCVGTATDAKAQVFSAYYNVQKAAYLQAGSAGARYAIIRNRYARA